MTIETLKEVLEEAVNNGLGNCLVYARFTGDKNENRKEIDFAQVVSFSDENYAEVILRR